MDEERKDERETGQHPPIHEQAEPAANPSAEDTNEYADDRVAVLQPDGDEAPFAKDRPQEDEAPEDER